MPPEMVHNILTSTNATAAAMKLGRWNELTKAEFYRFLGLWLAMCPKHPSRADHWSPTPSEPMHAGFGFGCYMSRRRFDSIVSAFSLYRDDPDDNLLPVRMLQKTFNEHMAKCYFPSWLVCVDESMSKWTQRWTCPVWVIVPRKPTPMGIEFHTAADHENRILFAVELVGDPKAVKYNNECIGKTASLVMRMTESLFGSSRVVALDSGFGVIEVLHKLKENGLYAVSIIKKKRYWPKYVGGQELNDKASATEVVGGVVSRKGVFKHNDKTTEFFVVGQRDSKANILAMSTWGTTYQDPAKKIRRRIAPGPNGIAEFARPSVLRFYYVARHAVDDSNNTRQGTTSIEEVWATKDWLCRIFGFFFGVIEANVRNAYNFIHKTNKSLADIRTELMEGLILYGGEDRAGGKSKASEATEAPTRKKGTKPDGWTGCWLGQTPKDHRYTKGGRFVPVESDPDLPYLDTRRRCVLCPSSSSSKSNMFCTCNPAEALCLDHFMTHFVEKNVK